MLLEIILSRHKNKVTTELVLKSDLVKRPAALVVSPKHFPLASSSHAQFVQFVRRPETVRGKKQENKTYKGG